MTPRNPTLRAVLARAIAEHDPTRSEVTRDELSDAILAVGELVEAARDLSPLSGRSKWERLRLAAAAFGLVLLVAGCAESFPPDLVVETPEPERAQIEQIGLAGKMRVYRVRDLETGALCYVADGGYKAGMSCLPSRTPQ